jgi:hypothetical protein
MTRDELWEAIEEPAKATQRHFEGGLVERILADIADAPGNLPLLQFALKQLWEQQTEAGALTHAAYEDIGGVPQALARHADTVYTRLDAASQEQMRRLLGQYEHCCNQTQSRTRNIILMQNCSRQKAMLS